MDPYDSPLRSLTIVVPKIHSSIPYEEPVRRTKQMLPQLARTLEDEIGTAVLIDFSAVFASRAH